MELLEMIAENCTQLLDVVQRSVIGLENYSRFTSTSAPALWRPDGLTYVITESCPAGESRCSGIPRDRDSSDPDRALAHMLLKELAWMIETIAPATGQEKS